MTPTSELHPVVIESAWALDWLPISTSDGNVPGPVWKVLREDAATGALTFMIHLPPNWHDAKLDYHPTTEEGFIIAGRVLLGDRDLTPGSYLYRPPGILHGPVEVPHDLGATIVQRTDGPLRILRYKGKKFPHQDLQPVTNKHLSSPVAWSEKTDSTKLRGNRVAKGGWKGARVVWLHKNTQTGGGLVLLDLPAGWHGTGSECRGPNEEFLLEGDLQAGTLKYGKWAYVYRPAGWAGKHYDTRKGAKLLAWWNGPSEL